MSEKAKKLDPLPDEFASYEEAAEFWDSHDTTDYPEAFAAEPIELHADFKSRRYEVEIAEDLMLMLRQRARESGTTVRELVSDQLRRQLAAT